MIYLATPYTHDNPNVMARRAKAAARLTGALMTLHSAPVFSSIVHCHGIALLYNLPRDYKFWLQYNKHFLDACSALWVATIPGWDHSKGIRQEVSYVSGLSKPIKMVDHKTLQIEDFDHAAFLRLDSGLHGVDVGLGEP